MPVNYPTSLDTTTTLPQPSGTQTLINPDHASTHTNLSGAIIAIETVLGTTQGTSVLKNIGAGQFAAKNNNDTFGTPTINGGTANNLTLGTPVFIGTTTINNSVFGTPSITGGTLTNSVLAGTPSATGTIALNEWTSANQPRCILTTQGTQSIANSTPTALTWENETINVGTMHGTADKTRLTCNEVGVYLVGGCIEYPANATGMRYITVAKNGIGNEVISNGAPAVNGNIHVLTTSVLVQATAGDYFQIGAYQTSGGTIGVGTTRSNAWAMRIA